MERGAHVWCNDSDGQEAWFLAEIVKKTDAELSLKQIDKDVRFTRKALEADEVSGERKYDGVELANAKLSKEEVEEGADENLITLPHLHEPAILHAVSERFFRGKIYTWTGPVLIAVNPFQRLDLYNNDILEAYRREGLFKSQGMSTPGEELEPHVFAVSDLSYRQMMKPERKSQAILISGESGAGKTETTKIVMTYLTTLGMLGEEQDDSGGLSVMQRVMQSNPVLEAFGNARTLRNDNSSRFGKFMELGFSRPGNLLGAKVQTYLLEKVRLAFHASGERNYHIFYQILRGATEEDKKKFMFSDGMTGGLELPNYFHFTGQGGAPHPREHTDESTLQYTLKGMKNLGWSQEKIDSVLALCAGILHLGQINFNSKIDDASGMEIADIGDEKSLEASAKLLGVDLDKMRVALTERLVVARGEEIRTQLTPDKASDARDALAKTIYGSLFLWVVDQVNQSVGWENDDEVRSSIGVLDIFGFECFAINSFEQLCINFTNEALQQQFNKFIFKLEQEEYNSEGIEWAFISFPDNQDCLDTIQMKKTGVLSMLDDECRLPKGSDKNFAKRMYDVYLPNKNQTESENNRFLASRIQQVKSIFCIRHFAGVVEYRAETNFMEKNKDEIPLTAKNLFETAPNELVRDAYGVQKRDIEGRAPDPAKAKPGRRPASKTVGQQFKEQLSSLIASVEKTDPHYIRCLKPNDAAKPKMLTRKRLTEQLRYGGVLEAVRVARAGYPVRLYHDVFFQRYRMLLPTVHENVVPWNMEGRDAKELCLKLIDKIMEEGAKHLEQTKKGPLDPNEAGITKSEKIRRMQPQPKPMLFPRSDVQLGESKVFLRKPPHDALEAHKVFHQHATATIIQTWVRGLEARRNYYTVQEALRMIQRVYRGSKGRERWWNLRKGDAGQLLTVNFRMLIVWRRYNRAKKGTIQLQALRRGYMSRKVKAIIKVQTFARMYMQHTKLKKLKSAMIALQCATRMKIAKKLLFEFKREQKDVGKLKENNEKLKNEMASLKAMLAAQANQSNAKGQFEDKLKLKQDEIAKLEKRVSELEHELEKQKAFVESLEAKLQKQRDQSIKDKKEIESLSRMNRASVASSGAAAPSSPRSPMRQSIEHKPSAKSMSLALPDLGASSADLEEHRERLSRLEDELDAERQLRREADGEIIKLRAAINGVKLNDKEVDALLAQTLAPEAKQGGDIPVISEDKPSEPEVGLDMGRGAFLRSKKTRESGSRKILATDDDTAAAVPVIPTMPDRRSQKIDRRQVLQKEKRPSFLRATADFLPNIRRGLVNNEEKDDNVVSVGWKVEVRTRKEREEALRDDVHGFEGKMKSFLSLLEDGVEVVLWQLNRTVDIGAEETDDFAHKSQNVTVQLKKKGDLFVQSELSFILRGGYLSKAIGRTRGDKTALEPLSTHDILEVKAGCAGYDHTELPTASGKTPSSKSKSKSKSKKSSGSSENRQSSLFMTIKATPTPTANSRSYILRFKSRSARNDAMHGLRSVLADMQINEGVGISNLHFNKEADMEPDKIMVPLSAVNQVINKERQNYDRILLMLWQGFEDLKEKEDELLNLRSKLERVVEESTEKDRVQANDSKLIMQLSKKLETLLMESEDLRDQNDRLNNRLVAVECEKMNLMK